MKLLMFLKISCGFKDEIGENRVLFGVVEYLKLYFGLDVEIEVVVFVFVVKFRKW